MVRASTLVKGKSSIYDPLRGKTAEVDSLGSLKVDNQVCVVGTSFSGTTLDENFWKEIDVSGTGAAVLAGEVDVKTGITADSKVTLSSLRRAQKVPGATSEFRFVGRFGTAPQANNLRRIGCYDASDGFFIQVNGTTFSIGSRKGGVTTLVDSGDFNGEVKGFVPSTSLIRLVIQLTVFSVKFIINGKLVHTIISDILPTNTFELPVQVENVNSGGNTTDNKVYVRLAAIIRRGGMETAGRTVGISGTGATAQVLKRSAGILKSISVLDKAGSIEIYDDVVSTGTPLGTIDALQVFGTLPLNIQLNNGLTLVANGATIIVTYE